MLSLSDAASIDAALTTQLDPRLRVMIEQRLASARDNGLADMTHIVVVQAGDTEADIVAEIGWSPLVNPIDGRRFGEPGFVAPWDWLQRHAGWHEMVVTVGNSGFAFILFIEDAPDTDPELLELCRAHDSP